MAAPAPAESRVKPTKPDEEAYKASLAQAEKEHTAAQEKLVCLNLLLNWIFCRIGAVNWELMGWCDLSSRNFNGGGSYLTRVPTCHTALPEPSR